MAAVGFNPVDKKCLEIKGLPKATGYETFWFKHRVL